MDSILIVAAQIAFVLSFLFGTQGRSRLSTRLLQAVSSALIIPAVLASWMLMFSVPIESGRLVAVLALVSMALLILRRQGTPSRSDLLQLRRLRWSLAVPLAIPFAVQITGAALKPEASIDGLLYHGPALANIVHEGSLFGWESANQYVYYSDLQMVLSALWLGATNVVSLEDAVQAPYVGVAALAVYVLSNQTSRYQLTRAWLSCGAVVAPVIWTQARVLYVDVAAAGLLAAGMALVVSYRRELDKLSVLAASLCLGAAIATKPSALFAGLICTGVGVVVVARSLKATHALACITLFVFSAAPFYIRNWLSFGNPFFPITTAIGPLRFPGILAPELFYTGGQSSGLIDPTRAYVFAKNLWVGMKLGSPRWLYDPREGGFGRAPLFLFAALVAFLLVVGVAALLRRRRGDVTTFPATPDSSAWIVLSSSILITFAQPNASDSRYVIPSYLLMVGFGVGLFALFPVIRAVDVFFSAAVACVTLAGMARSEANMLFGIQESIDLLRADQNYNTGIDGTAISYGDSFAWLRGTGCARILAQTAGGLGPQGMPGEGLLTTYQYGLWGDNLCNDVEFVAIGDLSAADTILASPDTLSRVTGSDFLVVDERSFGDWQSVLDDNDINYVVVATVPANDYFPVTQIVLELQDQGSE